MRSKRASLRRAAQALLASLALAGAAGVSAQSAPDERTERMRAAIDQARAEFAETVIEVSGLPRQRVWSWLPRDYRVSQPNFRIIVAVERERGTRLSNEERLRIVQAEDRMRTAIDRARLDLRRRAPAASPGNR